MTYQQALSDVVAETMAKREKPQHEKATADGAKQFAEILANAGFIKEFNPELFNIIAKIGAGIKEKINRGVGLTIRGDVGIGKSLGMKILAAQFPKTFIFRHVSEIESFYTENEKYADYWQDYMKGDAFFGHPRHLVIDDLGVEDFPFMLYGTKKNPLAELIEYRYRVVFPEFGGRTFFTTNLTDAEIINRYGKRNFDRLKEIAPIITIHGESRRGKIK